jgi:hypothetical protein
MAMEFDGAPQSKIMQNQEWQKLLSTMRCHQPKVAKVHVR